MLNKNFKIKAEDIISLAVNRGGCIANDTITVDGHPIRFMYREQPNNNLDSGWQFFSGFETPEFLANPSNSNVYDINTIANYEPGIIEYLDMPIGSDLVRVDGSNKFVSAV